INKMVAAIVAIDSADWGSNAELGKATVNVGVVRGGEKPNIVAPQAECDIIFRTVNDPEETRAKLERIAGGFGGRITLASGNAPQFMRVRDGAPTTAGA